MTVAHQGLPRALPDSASTPPPPSDSPTMPVAEKSREPDKALSTTLINSTDGASTGACQIRWRPYCAHAL